jgi:hypothetical protein
MMAFDISSDQFVLAKDLLDPSSVARSKGRVELGPVPEPMITTVLVALVDQRLQV